MSHLLETSLDLPLAPDDAFAFFADAFNLERITPPRLRFRILTPPPIAMGSDTEISYRMSLFGVPFSWLTLISKWEPPYRFVDEQIRGPYRRWVHLHEFIEDGEGTTIRDRVEYDLPFGPIGNVVHPFVRRELDYIFAYRAQAIRELLGVASPS